MPSPLLQKLIDEVTAQRTVVQSATTLISGFKARIDDALTAAIANGATEAELKPVADLATAAQADLDSLAAAITANTPTP